MVQSVQDRYNKKDSNPYTFFNQMVNMLYTADTKIEPYGRNTIKRDKALINFVLNENLLAGVLSSAISRDKNRGWTLTGTARQVALYGNKMHAFHNFEGWRQFVSLNSFSWYSTNVGYASEIGFRNNVIPETMWNLDPTKIKLNGKPEKPLTYYGSLKEVELPRNYYIHGNSMPLPMEHANLNGFCAVERCLEFTRLMMGIKSHHLEKLGVRPPKGIIHGVGIDEQEWEKATNAMKEARSNNDTKTYEGVMTLFTRNDKSKLTLLALSELPDNFSLKEFVEIVMQGYALAFGYPVGEFWAISSGSFGRAGEMEVQLKQATAKGELDFALSFQEQLQTYFLPSGVNFQFDKRNDAGEKVEVETRQMEASLIGELFEREGIDESGNPTSLLSKEEARVLLAERGILRKEWTNVQEDAEASDLQEIRKIRESLLTNHNFLQTSYYNPNEPIVRYTYNPDKPSKISFAKNINRDVNPNFFNYQFPNGQVELLWNGYDELIGK